MQPHITIGLELAEFIFWLMLQRIAPMSTMPTTALITIIIVLINLMTLSTTQLALVTYPCDLGHTHWLQDVTRFTHSTIMITSQCFYHKVKQSWSTIVIIDCRLFILFTISLLLTAAITETPLLRRAGRIQSELKYIWK